MMFRATEKKKNLINLENDISGFIEKPIFLCDENYLTEGVAKISIMIEKNPLGLIEILKKLASEEHAGRISCLFEDLVDKMTKLEAGKKLEVFFSNKKYLTELVNACVYNKFDLKRCIKAAPDPLDAVMINIVSNATVMGRILDTDANFHEEMKKTYSTSPRLS